MSVWRISNIRLLLVTIIQFGSKETVEIHHYFR